MSSLARWRTASVRGENGRVGEASDALFACPDFRGGVCGNFEANTSYADVCLSDGARGSGSGRPGTVGCMRVVLSSREFPFISTSMLRAAIGVRAFSTARVARIPPRAQRIMKKKNDENLRHAISLYHLSPSFFPAPQKKENAEEFSEELEDSVSEAILGPFSSEYEGRPFVQFANTNELMAEHTRGVQQGRRDTLGEVDVYDTSNIQRIFVTPKERADESTDDSLRSRQHFVNPPSAYPTRTARDAAGHGDLYRNEELSLRSAQVRDALFGTVAGELPSLEIVREREQAWKEGDQK